MARTGQSQSPGPARAGGADGSTRWYRLAIGVIALYMLIVVLALSTTHVMWPDDQYTDMNTLMSGENFAKYGMVRLRFLPMLYVGPLTEPPTLYTHYPPLTNVVNGLLQTAGIESLAVMRTVCGVLFVVGFVCMVLAFAPEIGLLPAACGLAFIGTTGFYYTYCISLHHTYNVFFLGVFLLLFMRAVRSERPAIGLWFGCWVTLMLESLVSFEFILYPQAFAWVYVIATGRLRKRWPVLLLLGTAPVVGVALHLLQNIWALGWSGAMHDVAEAFKRPGRGPVRDRWQALTRVPAFLDSFGTKLLFWTWPALVLLSVFWLTLASRLKDDEDYLRRTANLIIALVVASATWYVFMPAHVLKHPHTLGQLVPLCVVVMGGTIAMLLRWIARRGTALRMRGLAALGLLVVVFGQYQTITEATHKSFQERPPSFYLFEAMGPELLEPRSVVLTNTYSDAQLAYFLRRPVWRCPSPTLDLDRESLLQLQQRLPEGWSIRYYVYDPRGDTGVIQTLAENCIGRMLGIPNWRPHHPIIVFDLRNLLAPPGEREPLPPDRLEAQKRRRFKRWIPDGFMERLKQVLMRHGRIESEEDWRQLLTGRKPQRQDEDDQAEGG